MGYQRFTGDIDIRLFDSPENRQHLRAAFVVWGMGDYFMLDRMQFVPGWTDFHLINGMRLIIMIAMKGLEGYSFDESLQMAIADIDDVQVPFYI